MSTELHHHHHKQHKFGNGNDGISSNAKAKNDPNRIIYKHNIVCSIDIMHNKPPIFLLSSPTFLINIFRHFENEQIVQKKKQQTHFNATYIKCFLCLFVFKTYLQ
jgi:hypothetical protein